jgi:endonuclease YncB( thermonuclease family)
VLKYLLSAFMICALPAAAEEIVGHVTHIRDGDTFVLDQRPIRICGIQAPEAHHKAGPASSRALSRMIFGQRVRCVPVSQGSVCDGMSPKRSRDRVNAQCFVGDRDIAAEMVRLRQAKDWPTFSGGHYSR